MKNSIWAGIAAMSLLAAPAVFAADAPPAAPAAPAAAAPAAPAAAAPATGAPAARGAARGAGGARRGGRGALPENVEMRAVTVWCDGTKIAANVFKPKGMSATDKVPAILLCHGWGGMKSQLNGGTAPTFAAAGYIVMTFDYRGWGESQPRLVVEGDMPRPGQDGMVTVQAKAIREVVDPWDQQEDIEACIDFLMGEPNVDKDRLGIWGSSYGGGHVTYRAATDPRIKAAVSQVGAVDSKTWMISRIETEKLPADFYQQQDTLRARGEGGIQPVPQGVDVQENLRGTPYFTKMLTWAPVELAGQIKIPMLIIDAENEELFNIQDHGQKLVKILEANKVPVENHIIKGATHYAAYSTNLQEATQAAIAFYNKYLKKSS